MNRRDIEMLALAAIDRARRAERAEDSFVELKSVWPAEALKAARRIAGQANAAHGEPVLWVIGIDEKTGTAIGVPPEELANWLPAVLKHFDGVTPAITDLNMDVDGKTVVVLMFETDRSPFVVRVASDPITHEVPWREGTRVRSARREDLLRLLMPQTRLPSLQILDARVTRIPAQQNLVQQGYHHVWKIEASIYATPTSADPIVLPRHRANFEFRLPAPVNWRLWAPVQNFGDRHSQQVNQIVLQHADSFNTHSEIRHELVEIDPPDAPAGELGIHLGVAGSARTVVATTPLRFGLGRSGNLLWAI